MKKLLMLCVALIFFTAACGSGEAPVADKSSETSSAKTEGAKTESAKTEGLPSGHPSTSEGATPMAMTGHPQGTTAKVTKEVRLSEEVSARWSEVDLTLTDTATSKSDVLKFKVGKKVATKIAGLSLKVNAYIPDYTIFEDHIGSKSNDPNNPAVLLELFEGEKSVAKGWVFLRQEFKVFDSFNHPKIVAAFVVPEAKTQAK